jgi:hypothetical protein
MVKEKETERKEKEKALETIKNKDEENKKLTQEYEKIKFEKLKSDEVFLCFCFNIFLIV